jgi:glycosyltransferase involved in cell wall biosynthesis
MEADAVVKVGAQYSVLIPVHNEATLLPTTVPALLASIQSDVAEVVFVCNGCDDGSAALISNLTGDRARVIDLPKRGKTHAINIGDSYLKAFPRFYIDADITLSPDTLGQLRNCLINEEVELVAPYVAYDTSGASTLARYVSEISEALPHGKGGGFHCVLGISAAGRARWGLFPDILGDDIFIEATVPAEKRIVLRSACVTTKPPSWFWAWVLVRTRWIRGERQLSKMGINVVRTPGQAKALMRLLLTRNTFVAASVYLLVRGLAKALACVSADQRGWYRDRK